MREEDVPAQQPEAQEEARLPPAHALAQRPRRDRAAAIQGSQPPVGLIWAIRDRASFRALTTGARRRRGVLTVTTAPSQSPGPPRVAYAIGRRAGGAVERNRIRRRLRAVVREERAVLRPDALYLVSAGPAASTTSYCDLRTTFRAIIDDLHREPAR
jgi:ribonuclease P protein component